MLIENIKEAIQNLAGNKMRSLLTMLGIIIGITAVITITTIGTSIKSTLNATMNSLGGNSIYAYVEAYYPENEEDWESWDYPEMKEDDYITQEMLDELKETYPEEISGYSISSSLGYGQIYKSSEKYANVSVSGCTPSDMEYMKLKIIRGRNVTDLDLKKGKRVCLVSDTMTSYYFGDEDPIGQQIVFNSDDGKSYEFTIVGVYEYNAAVFGKQDTSVPEKDRTTQMYIPVTTVTNLSEDESGYSYVTILLQTGADATLAQSEVDEFFSEKYEDNENWHIYTYNMSSDMGMINTVINVITIAIAFIAAISLIVGGVGVMNIMLVSITERTREIGIRKALGAKNKTIHQQFLIESVVLCLIGGVIGILLGLLFGFLLGKVAMVLINTYYADYSSYIIMNVRPSGIAILISVCVSMLIGIFFGSYPAKKAAKMEVIDALRYE
jgi:putative ABC transport system permease protein